jgi:hypothetical protein
VPCRSGAACAVGDLGAKHGPLRITATPGGSTSLWTDSNLPLSGVWSVGGRSLVVHAANGSLTRMACADTGTGTLGRGGERERGREIA